MQEYDVVIVGSGPAGSSCAKALKDEGHSVLVLEKAKLPRHKTCSGVLMGQTQQLLKAYFGSNVQEEVYCENRYIEADAIYEWTPERGFSPSVWELDKDGRSFPRTYLNVWRNKFDKWLLDQSGAASCEGTRVRWFDASGAIVKVHAQRVQTNEPTEFGCKYLVGADGNASTIRRLLADDSHDIQKKSSLSRAITSLNPSDY